MRLLLVTNMFPSSAHPYSGIFVAREAQALERAGVTVQVEAIAGMRGSGDYFAARSRIRQAAQTFKADVCHAHYGYSLVVTAGLDLPVVATFYGDDVNGESNGRGGVTLKSRVGRWVTNYLGRRARQVLVQSEAMRQRLWPGLREHAQVLASGIDDHLFHPGDRTQARLALGLPADGVVLGFVNSGNQPTKRMDLAQATRDELVRRGRAVHLLVAEKVAAEAMPAYFQASDCLLMTSDSEGSPNAVKEALACGTPVVSVPVGDVPDIVTRPEQGRIVARAPAAIADGVEAVLQSTGSGRSLLPEHLNASFVAQRLIEIYRRVLQS